MIRRNNKNVVGISTSGVKKIKLGVEPLSGLFILTTVFHGFLFEIADLTLFSADTPVVAQCLASIDKCYITRSPHIVYVMQQIRLNPTAEANCLDLIQWLPSMPEKGLVVRHAKISNSVGICRRCFGRNVIVAWKMVEQILILGSSFLCLGGLAQIKKTHPELFRSLLGDGDTPYSLSGHLKAV